MEANNYTTTVEDLGGLNRKVNITIDMKGVELALDEAADVVAKKVDVKGFRKGKAPRKIIRNLHAKEVKNVATYMLTQSGFSCACREQNLMPLEEPKLEKAEIGLDGTFKCEMTMEIKPVIVPIGYVGMSLEKKDVNLDANKMLEDQIENLYESHCVREARKEVQEGFEATVDFWVFVGEEKINEGKDQVFTIKKGQEPPFGENLLGAKMGEIQSADITLPENFKQHGGETASVKMDVKLVCEKVRPTVEQLVEKTQSPSYDALLDIIKEDIAKHIQQQEHAMLEEQVVDKLIEMHEFFVPQKWVDGEEKYLVNQLQLIDPDEETMKMVRGMAERNVKRTFIIESIYAAEKQLALTEEEVEGFIKVEAERLNISTLALKSELKKQNMIDGVLGLIKNNKVMNYILSNAQIEEKSSIIIPG